MSLGRRVSSSAPRALRLGLRAGLILATCWAALRGWERSYVPVGVPSFDVGDYLGRALELLDGPDRWSALWAPDVHPPGHPLALALWMALTERSLAAAAWLSGLWYLVAMALLVGLGARMDRDWGVEVGLIAALAVTLSPEHQRLLAAPMTEPLAACTVLLVLLMGLRCLDETAGWKHHLGLGLALIVAGMVRYSNAPMLWGALALAGWVRSPRRAFLPLLWALPTVAVLGVWEWARPGVLEAMRTFFVNVDSGSDAGWRWVPETLSERYLPVGPGLVPIGLALVGTLVALARREALAVVGIFAIGGLVGAGIHPYKLERVLHPMVGPLVLAALLALRWRAVPAVIGVIAAALLLWGERGLDEAGRLGRREVVVDQDGLIEQIVEVTHGSEQVVLSNGQPALSAPALALLLRLETPGLAVMDEQRPPSRCGEVGPSAPAICTPRTALAALQRPGHTVVWITSPPAKHPRGGPVALPADWATQQGDWLAAEALASNVPMVLDIKASRGVRVRAWSRPAE